PCGSSGVALSPDRTSDRGTRLDSYTPENVQALTDEDLDLSSTTIEILPTFNKDWPRLGVQSGKDGRLRLLNLENLSGNGGPAHLGGELQIVDLPQGNMVMTQPQAWLDGRKTWLFVANNDGVTAFELIANEDGDPLLVLRWTSDLGGRSTIHLTRVHNRAGPHRTVAVAEPTGTDLWG